MSWSVTSIKRAPLATALLPLAKAQSRITFDRDDQYCGELVAEAIDDVERAANTTLFERTIDFVPDVAAGTWTPYWTGAVAAGPNDRVCVRLPFNNVTSFTALDADDVDVSDDYQVHTTDPGGVGTAVLESPIPAPAAGVRFTFNAGTGDPDALAPSIKRAILRRFAALYENREAPLDITEPGGVGVPLVWSPSA